jgi:hypothetical protein
MPNPVVNTIMIEMVNPSKGSLQVVLSDYSRSSAQDMEFPKIKFILATVS